MTRDFEASSDCSPKSTDTRSGRQSCDTRTSDAGPAVELTDITEPVETNSNDSLSNPEVLSDEHEPDEATKLEASSDASADLPEN